MKKFTFIQLAEETEKAYKFILVKGGYSLELFKVVAEKYVWVPKSVCNVSGNECDVQEWFYNKNIAVNTYGYYMKSLANS